MSIDIVKSARISLDLYEITDLLNMLHPNDLDTVLKNAGAGHPTIESQAQALAEKDVDIAELVKAVEGALRIEDLWMPGVMDNPAVAKKLHLMRNSFLSLAAKHKVVES